MRTQGGSVLLAALGLGHVKFRIWERGRQHFPLGEPLKGSGYEPQEEALGAFPINFHLEWDFHSRFSLIANFHCSHPLHFTFHLTTKAVVIFPHTWGTERQQSQGKGGNKLASLQLAVPFSSLENSEWSRGLFQNVTEQCIEQESERPTFKCQDTSNQCNFWANSFT